jgi:hypothetical protein
VSDTPHLAHVFTNALLDDVKDTFAFVQDCWSAFHWRFNSAAKELEAR